MSARLHQSETHARIALWVGLFVAALAAVVLVGWKLDLAALKSVLPDLVTMKANTALGMLLCGIALALRSRASIAAPSRFCVIAMAALVAGMGALTLIEYLFGRNLGIDQLLFTDPGNPAGPSLPGRMSATTAFCLVLAGVALWSASQPTSMRLQASVLAALGSAMTVIAGMALAAYVLDLLLAVHWSSYSGMAVHTAAGFLLLGVGLLELGRGEGWVKWSLDGWTTGGFILGIVSLFWVAGLSYRFTSRLQDSAGLVSHTQEIVKENRRNNGGCGDSWQQPAKLR